MMKGRIVALLMTLALLGASVYAAENPQKQDKKQKQKEQTEKLVNSKHFQFVARQAMPLGGKTLDLTTNPNFVRFYPDSIQADMPFFGRAYNVPYGGTGGIKFDGKPKKFDITPQKKGKGYLIQATVNDTNDSYSMTLSISNSGYGTLTINSNNRNSISYYGQISALEDKESE
jgi:ABC-type oligopeptide transport system substrate-binding subunit